MHNEEEYLKLREEEGKMFKKFCFRLKGTAKMSFYHGNIISLGIGLNMAQTSLRQKLEVKTLNSSTPINLNMSSVTLTAFRMTYP